jgi:hypothetical protein
VELQQEIEVVQGSISPSFLRVTGRPLKIRLVEIHHPGGWAGCGDGSGFEDFVIERDGQFFLTQTGTDEQPESAGDGLRLGDGFAPNGIHNGIIRQFNIGDNKPALKPKVLELIDVNHSQIQTPFIRGVHPKMILAAVT